jgi:hypothetical protein
MKIVNSFPVEAPEAYSVDINGWNFTLIYGQRNGNGFIAIPDWGVCSEAADPHDVFYNTETFKACKNEIVSNNAREFAQAVKQLFTV